MKWILDKATENLAIQNNLLSDINIPTPQYPGHSTNPSAWTKSLGQLASELTWPEPILTCSPQEIITQFKNGNFLQGMILVVSWGAMGRTANSIYGHRSKDDIYNSLSECVKCINAEGSIEGAWHILTNNLCWSAVMASKTIHFLCRSVGIENDPPVPIDNKIVLNKIWPNFIINIASNEKPKSWCGSSYPAYLRYMTAINTWAKSKNWTTTQTETSLFSKYSNLSKEKTCDLL